MAVTILVPTALRAFTERQKSVAVEADTVGAAVAALGAAYPDIRQHLFEDSGELRSYINIFVGEANVKATGGLETPLKDGDSVMLVPAIAGGSEHEGGVAQWR
jgi:MoaD family protein